MVVFCAHLMGTMWFDFKSGAWTWILGCSFYLVEIAKPDTILLQERGNIAMTVLCDIWNYNQEGFTHQLVSTASNFNICRPQRAFYRVAAERPMSIQKCL